MQQKQLELGDRMDLASYLLKPVQRMGKYALLLKQILKECPETEPEYADLKVSQRSCGANLSELMALWLKQKYGVLCSTGIASMPIARSRICLY